MPIFISSYSSFFHNEILNTKIQVYLPINLISTVRNHAIPSNGSLENPGMWERKAVCIHFGFKLGEEILQHLEEGKKRSRQEEQQMMILTKEREGLKSRLGSWERAPCNAA
ncbi:hypothetical protein JTE90_003115 [Oedothorax gibbosus]|uniref:Uncharacterized protein n=1 Tax=Oedothorax gibbosus TaxID=931172 RepID=A0AAV6VF38_9ARAC|nr:hypothetical protein JTE90_003115 [Oedothorax gibbosus]